VKCWLVFESKQYYDGGDKPLLICLTKSGAELAKLCIQKYADHIKYRLGDWPDCDSPDYEKILTRRESIITKARWPYGIKFDVVDICNMGVMSIKELKAVK
jgi:hypothetical protein